jgi:hypothetical protein
LKESFNEPSTWHGYIAKPTPAAGLAGLVQHMIAQEWSEHPEVWERFSTQLSEELYDCVWGEDDDDVAGEQEPEADFSAENGDVSEVVIPQIAATLSFLQGAEKILRDSRGDPPSYVLNRL